MGGINSRQREWDAARVGRRLVEMAVNLNGWVEAP